MFPFFIICFFAFGVFVVCLYYLRGLPIDGHNSDGLKQIRGAAKAGEWKWPSDMHKAIPMKARMKDVGVLSLVLLQRLLNDRNTFWPLSSVSAAYHAGSIVLIYFVSSHYWGMSAALIVTGLFSFSVWPFQIILRGGYQGISVFFVLLAVLCLQLATAYSDLYGVLLYCAAGFFFGLMMFSSSSCRKLIPLFLAATIYSLQDSIVLLNITFESLSRLHIEILGNPLLLAGCVIAVGVGVVGSFACLMYNRIIAAVYYGYIPRFVVGNLLARRKEASIEKYLRHRHKVCNVATSVCKSYVAYLVVCIFLSREEVFYEMQASIILGFALAALLLLLPNVVRSLAGYIEWWTDATVINHFLPYGDRFLNARIPFDHKKNGVGWRWHPRFFLRMAPFLWGGFLCSIVLLIIEFLKEPSYSHFIGYFSLLCVSLSPIIWGEVTHAPQEARSYYPSVLGLLVLIGWSVSVFDSSSILFIGLTGSFLLAALIWNIRMLVTDVWPARMAVLLLMKTLDRLDVKRLYTYDTPFNHMFVSSLPVEYMQRLEVCFIRTLSDISEGYVAIPATSEKGVTMVGNSVAVNRGDFRDDPIFNSLLDSRSINDVAVEMFKTENSSRFWVHEDQVTSYRDLILNEIFDEDRWRGNGWLLDVKKIHALG